ncbi:E3 ubiquitin-protein ligase TRIM39-like isoform X2 [Rhinatrema bivittatum]|uniref:E3 ubiquitin-protein ligase TRIM39-like isoform X2 n=1 Tax=Rhinatrema bivittatum TaxID=194408 RepID=UPI00112D402F|nr:E3 ubiquitin-protein ligase TRIM39-like isoform X2 [Rhinatrema bivittatum]
MAAVNPAACTVCQDYFKDPVTAKCGHNFCRSCIARCWEGLQADFPCPQCRETSQERVLIPNRQLGNMTEMIKQLFQRAVGESTQSFCEKHKETLKLFCEDEEKPICVVCGLSRDHKAHTMFPIEEAVQEYKVKLQQCLDLLRSKLGDVMTWQSDEEEKTGELKMQVAIRRLKILSDFEELRELLNEEQQVFLNRLEGEEREILQKLNENISKLSEQRSSLEQLITEIEEKCQQPATDFLQGVKSLLFRGEHVAVPHPDVILVKLRKNTASFPRQELALNKIVKKLKVHVASVILDPETANPHLALSENCKHVRWRDAEQKLLKTPKRFHAYPCALGCQGFTSGKHYWEVQVGKGRNWSLGVAKGSVSRKGIETALHCRKLTPKNDPFELKVASPMFVPIFSNYQSGSFLHPFHAKYQRRDPQKGDMLESPDRGIWALEQWQGQYQALTSPVTLLTPSESPRKLGVYLDYEGGRLTFYDADTAEHLYAFSSIFTEKIFPYFCIWSGTEIRLQ